MVRYGEKARENVIHVSLLASGGVDEWVGGGGEISNITMGSNHFKV